jgi:hypothetical protein
MIENETHFVFHSIAWKTLYSFEDVSWDILYINFEALEPCLEEQLWTRVNYTSCFFQFFKFAENCVEKVWSELVIESHVNLN